VFQDSILSFTFDDTPHPAHVWNRIKEHQSDLSLTSDWICYALMYAPTLYLPSRISIFKRLASSDPMN
jgi:Mg2+ and Co2+ transporter CorA